MAESEEELKSLFMMVKEESKKTGLTLSIKKKIRSWHLVPSLHDRRGKSGSRGKFSSSWALKSLQMMTAALKLEEAYFLEGKL